LAGEIFAGEVSSRSFCIASLSLNSPLNSTVRSELQDETLTGYRAANKKEFHQN